MALNKTRKKTRGGNKPNILRAEAEEFVPKSLRNSTKRNSILNLTEKLNSLHLTHNQSSNPVIENAVAIDCEMVAVGRQSVLAHVAIVDFNGNEIYNKYVIPKGGVNSVTNYRTAYSGITRSDIESLDKVKHSFARVKREVHGIIKNKIIVGHGLANDFKVLEFIPSPEFVWNTTEIDTYKQNDPYKPGRRPRKLKAIAMEFTGNNIQKSSTAGHSPLEDARASMNLYRVAMGYPKVVYNDMSK